MNNYTVHIDTVSDKFTGYDLSQCTLYLQAGPRKLTYAVTDSRLKQVLKLRSFVFGPTETAMPIGDIEDIVMLEGLAGGEFGSIKAGITSSACTLVPENLFVKEEARTYLDYVANISRDDVMSQDYIEELKSYNVYVIDRKLGHLLKSSFPTAAICHTSTGLMKQGLADYADEARDVMLACVDKRNVEVLLYNNGKFKFYNKFGFKTTKDFIYYLMLVCDEFELDTQKLRIYLAGDIDESSATYDILRRYAAEPKFCSKTGGFRFDEGQANIPVHRLFSLFSLERCA